MIDTEDALLTNQWSYDSSFSFSGSDTYDMDDYNVSHPYIFLVFTIRRRNEGYIRQIMVPAVLLSVVNICLLLMKPESPERIVLYFIGFFSYGLFIEQLRWM